MEEIIASYLVQKGNCQLPDIGHLKMEMSLAANDVVSKELQPPQINYKFNPVEGDLTEGLIEYTAEKENITIQQAKQRLEGWCEETSKKLNQNQSVTFPTIGTLKKEDDKIDLVPDESRFSLPPVKSIRVIHENDSHKVIVGDNETNTQEMKEFYQEAETKPKVKWYVPALIIFGVAVILYLLYLTSGGFGNYLNPADPTPTYISK